MIHEETDARDCLKDYPDIHLLTTLIKDRKVYRDAMSDGLGVVEMGNDKATAEIKNVVKEIL